jgi:hypothetical protein
MKQASGVILAAVLGTAAIARAQPAPRDPPSPDGRPTPVSGDPDDAADGPTAQASGPTGSPTSPYGPPPPSSAPDPGPLLGGQIDPPRNGRSGQPRVHPPVRFPVVLTTPTGWLLPAGVLYSRNAVDTGGGVTSDSRVGLGDVAEFGVATTDEVRERTMPDDKPDRIQPYVTASFRLGVAENRLFAAQPGVTLGFRKSFEREHNGFKTRIAELTLVASKHLGPDVALHVGGVLWDASMQATTAAPGDPPPTEFTLHGHGLANQVRVFGGFEARPLPRSQILIDLGWAPEFCYQCTTDNERIKLRPELSWGVRYQVASFMHIESGVRVPDIGNFNLLDAQIFGQITFTSFALSDAVETLK